MPRPSTGLLTGSANQRRVPVRGRITRQLAACCVARLLVLATEYRKQPIVMYIDSPGGLVIDSLTILQAMDGIKCPVATFCNGQVGGTAVVLAAHGLPGFRIATPNARFSLKLSTVVADPKGRGQSHFPEAFAERLANDIRKSQAEVSAWLKDGAEFTPQQALAYGLIDAISSEPVLPKPV